MYHVPKMQLKIHISQKRQKELKKKMKPKANVKCTSSTGGEISGDQALTEYLSPKSMHDDELNGHFLVEASGVSGRHTLIRKDSAVLESLVVAYRFSHMMTPKQILVQIVK